jgi:hypothetical protein
MRATIATVLFIGALGQVAGAQSAERAEDARVKGVGGRAPNRARLEAQLRQTLATRARVELALTQDQMSKLSDVETRFGPQLRTLDQRENETRRSLRMSLQETPSADQDRRVGQLHEQLLQLQRQRLDMIVAEQKDLSGFLSNTQRVRFEALKENFRRQIQMNLGRGGPGDGRRGPPPPR